MPTSVQKRPVHPLHAQQPTKLRSEELMVELTFISFENSLSDGVKG